MPSVRRRAPLTAMLLLAATQLTGCAPQAATIEGSRIEWLYTVFLIAAAAVFVIVAGLIGWSIVRYRARGDDDELPRQTRDNRRLEIVWWALPTILVIGLFVVTAQVLSEVDARDTSSTVAVRVTGYQWQWRFAYGGTDIVIQGEPGDPPTLVLPVGERIAFELESPDVVHSFWVPDFLMKRDVVPGRTNHIELTIDEAGTYRGQCAEFCGLLHDQMLFSIQAVPAADFADWLDAQGGA